MSPQHSRGRALRGVPRPAGRPAGRPVGRRGVVTAAVALLAIGALTGCSNDNTVAAQANARGGKGYVAGDGTLQLIAPKDRRTLIELRGSTLEGTALDTTTWRGKVVVVNTWGSWCPPCNAEAPGLQRVWSELSTPDGASEGQVQFLGVNVREGAQTGLAFQRKLKVSYPSLAWDGGQILLQLQGKASTTPTTLVLDRQGRLAARVSGMAEPSTLRGLIDDVVAERG